MYACRDSDEARPAQSVEKVKNDGLEVVDTSICFVHVSLDFSDTSDLNYDALHLLSAQRLGTNLLPGLYLVWYSLMN